MHGTQRIFDVSASWHRIDMKKKKRKSEQQTAKLMPCDEWRAAVCQATRQTNTENSQTQPNNGPNTEGLKTVWALSAEHVLQKEISLICHWCWWFPMNDKMLFEWNGRSARHPHYPSKLKMLAFCIWLRVLHHCEIPLILPLSPSLRSHVEIMLVVAWRWRVYSSLKIEKNK